MFHVHFSNRFQPLADRLVGHLSQPREDVFTADQVVVPGISMRRALTLAIADRDSVCANVEFSYLARWLWTQVASVVRDTKQDSPFEPASLTWRVYAAFGDKAFVQAHPRLGSYLAAAKSDEVMRYELAVRTAELVEQYVTYRPDWLVRWQRGESIDKLGADQAWQADLWRRIANDLGLGAEHPVHAMARALAAGGADFARSRGLPAVVHVFGLPAMPPLYLEGLQALGRCIDVHLYAINPCREYWYEVVDLKQLARLEAEGRGQLHEEGNRLLASWGKQAQASLGLISGVADDGGALATADYVESGTGTLLAQLQDAVLDLQDISPDTVRWQEGDRSIEIHVCHSLVRELEVLHDHLLGLFAADPTLQPYDVLVVTPDLEAAAPLVDAVFGTAPRARRIPYALTGRARSSVNAPVRAFVDLLSLVLSRCPATAVFALLQQPAVARRFGLDDAGLQQVRDWMLASGMHWALDAEHIESLGLPATAAHTLADGMERLYLGYALPDEVTEPFHVRLPSGSPEGSSAVALGAFSRFVQELTTLRKQVWRERSATEWAAYLQTVADAFIEPDNGEKEDHVELHATLNVVADAMARAGFEEKISAPVLRAALERALDDPARGGVPTGRVTFAAMTGLRNLPFKVVCAVGMNDGKFPSPDRPSEFDLLPQAPRRGDRRRGDDQRTLFLDLLLAAGQSVYISYTGKSIRDNSVLPPSVLVSELLDAVGHRDRLVVEHPLQPFSPRAFGDGGDERLRSFDEELAQALRESLAKEAGVVPQPTNGGATALDEEDDEAVIEPAIAFFSHPLPAPAEEWREVTARQLAEFFNNPARYLLARRLKLDLPRDQEELQDDEPFLPDGLRRIAFADRLLPLLLQGVGVETVRTLARAGTELPPGTIGEAEREREIVKMGMFAQRVRAATQGEPLPPHQASVALDIDGEQWVVQSGFAGLRADGFVRHRYSDEAARDILDAGIQHLLLCAAPPAGAAASVSLLSRDGSRQFCAMSADEARAALAVMVGYYRQGLRGPIPFAPKTAWTLVQHGEFKARQTWTGSDFYFGEKEKPGYALALRGREDLPDDPMFEETASAVFGAIPSIFMPWMGEPP
ncbi:MAG: exodeoxyribonuclease V subunit gamma [Burkholderiales bacterium]|nr:exodeoxyribonuclease V subunit gamma [Burkholderiales bacterium]